MDVHGVFTIPRTSFENKNLIGRTPGCTRNPAFNFQALFEETTSQQRGSQTSFLK